MATAGTDAAAFDVTTLVEPDVPIPADREVPDTDGTRLARAVLFQAFEDMRLGHGPGCRGHLGLVRDCEALAATIMRTSHAARRVRAISWAFGFCDDPRCSRDHGDAWPFSFASVCSALRLDAGAVREGLLRWDFRGCREV